MEQQNKYYTPELSDLRIGYECELWEDNQAFIKGKITKIYQGKENEEDCLGLIIDNGNGYLIDQFRVIKTLFLTNEQIESEGWKIEGAYPGGKILFIIKLGKEEKHGYELIYNNTALKITRFWTMWDTDKILRETVFRGKCLSINELRIISKQVLEL